jgi:hypothetical protein
MSDTLEYLFTLPIGDWSGDGHGKCNWYRYRCNKTLDELREAYFASKEVIPSHLCPENVACEYELSTVSGEDFEALCELFPCLEELADSHRGEIWVSSEFMAAFVIEFIRRSLPDLRIEEIKSDMLPFFGSDEKGRHISHIGYGCL